MQACGDAKHDKDKITTPPERLQMIIFQLVVSRKQKSIIHFIHLKQCFSQTVCQDTLVHCKVINRGFYITIKISWRSPVIQQEMLCKTQWLTLCRAYVYKTLQ